ncbi:ATP-binding protein [Vibrio owensii]|uniref:ATP-binding protein n=1 Tax=Vibrio owensii TaxID=696485 RepID=UPI003AAA42E2
MKLLKRLKKLMPEDIQPHSPEKMDKIRKDESRKISKEIYEQNQQMRVSKAIGRSGIKKRHQNCSFDNFVIQNSGQQHALNEAKAFGDDLLNGSACGGFIFAGTPGTGKNHLACAIANQALQQGLSVLVITCAELMLKVRDTYRQDSTNSEKELVSFLSDVDFLVIDEFGVQHNTKNDRLTLSSIINGRYALEKPTGVLTNLEGDELITTLGRTSSDRIMGDCKWVTFNWPSFRTNRRW